MRKLLIAQHSETIADQLQHALQDEWEVHVCIDSYPVIDMMQYMRPEAMVLDLNLEPKDGIAVLEEAQSFLPPIVVATSNYVDDHVAETVEQLGAGALVRIPFRTEYIKEQLDHLARNCTECLHEAAWHLRLLGINPKLSGYFCLLAGIQILASNPHLLLKEVYPVVAGLCEQNDVRCVERSNRTAIHNAWMKRNVAIWSRYFPINDQGDVDKPSNKEFMMRIAEEL